MMATGLKLQWAACGLMALALVLVAAALATGCETMPDGTVRPDYAFWQMMIQEGSGFWAEYEAAHDEAEAVDDLRKRELECIAWSASVGAAKYWSIKDNMKLSPAVRWGIAQNAAVGFARTVYGMDLFAVIMRHVSGEFQESASDEEILRGLVESRLQGWVAKGGQVPGAVLDAMAARIPPEPEQLPPLPD